MRIAVDIRDLQIASTGTKTYLLSLCRAFPIVAPQHEFVFLSPKWKLFIGNSTLQKIINHVAFYYWKEIELPWLAWRKNCDIIFCTDYVVPLIAHCPTVPVFHGSNFWEKSSNYNRFWRFLLNLLAIPAAKKSPVVITVSQFARERIFKTLRIPLEKIIPVYEAPKDVAVEETMTKDHIDQILRRYGLSSETPYILHVGVMDKRKNLPRLIHGFVRALPCIGYDFRLVLVGKPPSSKAQDDSSNILRTIKNTHCEDKVVFTGYVPDDDLKALYQSAHLYVFPSEYEGFGLPALEAFANGLPLIASKAAAIPEVVGDAAILFDPYNCEEITSAIIKVANDENLRTELITRGYQRLSKFSWEKCAREIVEIFEDISSKG